MDGTEFMILLLIHILHAIINKEPNINKIDVAFSLTSNNKRLMTCNINYRPLIRFHYNYNDITTSKCNIFLLLPYGVQYFFRANDYDVI